MCWSEERRWSILKTAIAVLASTDFSRLNRLIDNDKVLLSFSEVKIVNMFSRARGMGGPSTGNGLNSATDACEAIVFMMSPIDALAHQIRNGEIPVSESKIEIPPLSAAIRERISRKTDQVFGGQPYVVSPSGETILRREVDLYNTKAELPLACTLAKLEKAGQPDFANFVADIYIDQLPNLILAGQNNLVHHTAHVMDYISAIALGERLSPEDLRVCVTAALFHDTGLGQGKLVKIGERDLANAITRYHANEISLDDVFALRQRAIDARLEHMELGAQNAQSVIGAFEEQYPGMLSPEQVAQVVSIVRKHDFPKISLIDGIMIAFFEDSSGPDKVTALSRLRDSATAHLLDLNDRLLQIHHEADALWMLSPEGLVADIIRSAGPSKPSAAEMVAHNMALQRREADLYGKLMENSTAAKYGFQGGTLYRTNTGYALSRFLENLSA